MDFKNNSTMIIVPGFDGIEPIEILVKRPQLMSMMSQGKVPNHLLSYAAKATMGKSFEYTKKDEVEKAKELADWVAFFCELCMVKPTYEEVKDTITDDQALSIYAWAVAPIDVLKTFRDKQKDASNNVNVTQLKGKRK